MDDLRMHSEFGNTTTIILPPAKNTHKTNMTKITGYFKIFVITKSTKKRDL
jgi:hypothetical protein